MPVLTRERTTYDSCWRGRKRMAVNVLSLVRDPDLCFKQGRLSLAVARGRDTHDWVGNGYEIVCVHSQEVVRSRRPRTNPYIPYLRTIWWSQDTAPWLQPLATRRYQSKSKNYRYLLLVGRRRLKSCWDDDHMSPNSKKARFERKGRTLNETKLGSEMLHYRIKATHIEFLFPFNTNNFAGGPHCWLLKSPCRLHEGNINDVLKGLFKFHGKEQWKYFVRTSSNRRVTQNI